MDQLDAYAQALADSEVRNQIVSLVLQAKAKDIAAADHIEWALQNEFSTPCGIPPITGP